MGMGKVLVTGGTGFIGSHTVVELINKGFDVVIVDDLSNSEITVLDKIEKITGIKPKFYKLNILDDLGIKRVFSENEIDSVIHFAGFKAVGESVAEPLKYYHNNITGTINLLNVMKEFNCGIFIFSSSATVYGMNNEVPFKEEYKTSATNPYGYTKLMIEQILQDISLANPNLSNVLLRYFNPIGAHESGLIGEKPNGIPNNLLPYALQVATGKREKLNVFGNDYDTSDGTGVRDYIHVVDLAKGHLSALNYAMEHKGVEIVNLGTGKGSSVLEVLKSLEKASGKEIAFSFAPRRAGDIASCYADTAYAKKLLNWEAEKNLLQMCEDGWRFAKDN